MKTKILTLVAFLALLVGCHATPTAASPATAGGLHARAASFTQGPVYLSSPPTLVNNQVSPPLVDSLGNAQMNSATKIAGEDLANDVLKTEQRFSYTHQAGTTAGVLIKSGAGFLHSLTINTPLAACVVTLDDAVSATTPNIAIVTYPAALLSGPVTLIYDVNFATGLELVIATANCDVTVAWR